MTVGCTLQDFYNGCVKTLQYFRQEVELDGQTHSMKSVTKQIIVKPGINEYNSLTFKGEGHQSAHEKNTDLIVTFDEFLPVFHPNLDILVRYRRSGYNLIYTYTISLRDALNTIPIKIKTLDGRTLLVANDEIITPATVIAVRGEGLPVFDK